MKKNIIIFISFLILYLVFKNYELVSISVISISYLFLKNILPYFITIFIISKILINYNIPYFISKLFNNNIYIYILFISFISGTPNNIILIKDLLNNNIINYKEANIYIKCSFFNNPLFLYTMLNSIFNTKLAMIIIFIGLLSNILIYLRKPIKNTNINKIDSISLNNILIKSIKESINTLEFIYISIIIFNIIIILIPTKLNNFIGLIEITQGLNYLKYNNINTFYKLILSIIYISFGGISIHTQIIHIIDNTKIKYSSFLKGRIYQIIISIILITIIYRIII